MVSRRSFIVKGAAVTAAALISPYITGRNILQGANSPLSGKKVLVSEGPITDFLKPQSKNSGIMIARPVF